MGFCIVLKGARGGRGETFWELAPAPKVKSNVASSSKWFLSFGCVWGFVAHIFYAFQLRIAPFWTLKVKLHYEELEQCTETNDHPMEKTRNLIVAPGKGLEPLRAKGPLASLPTLYYEDLEASALTTLPPRLD